MTSPTGRDYRTPARPLGLQAGIDLDKALALASDLEDTQIIDHLDADFARFPGVATVNPDEDRG